MAKAYGWTPAQVDDVPADTLDWLVAIQGLEAEMQDEARKKQEREIKRVQAGQRHRRR